MGRSEYKKLSHVIYYHVYHIVWTPKYRYKILNGSIKSNIEKTLHMLCEWKKVEIKELNIQKDHIHIVVFVPPKISISNLMGILKGKTAIKIFKSFPDLKKKPYWGNHFWSVGYCSNTVGLDEEQIRKYVKYQEEQEKQIESEQMRFEF
ncbi:MAG: IS200/IS605 family transposase [Draconibacterium sp.]|nr:IS200/IS605 family transposase [Draconibacterium sp.]